jgi:diguanylate cyclase (GGDEF)-like protein/PAS domain S-box-containing protein
MLLATLEATADGILVVDRTGKIVRYNKRFADMWRLPEPILEARDDDRAIAHVLRQLKNPDSFVSKIRELYADPKSESFDVLRFIDGRVFERYSIPQCIDGEPIGRVWSFRDVTDRAIAEEALKNSRATLAEAQQLAHLGSWSMDFASGDVVWSEEIYRIYGLTEGVDKPVPFSQYDHPDDAPTVHRATEESKRLREPFAIDHRILRRDGSVRWVQERGDFFFDRNGAPLRSVGTMTDITERKEAEQQLARHAHYDSLTELPNRTLLTDRLNQAIAYSDRHKRPTAVLFLDLDRFKNVNDTLGHSIGDLLLKAVAGRLKRSVRAVDCVARLGGDEFIIVLTDLPNSQAAMKIAQKIVNETGRSYVVSGHELFTTASIGISMYPADGHDVETLLRNSDTAMYKAKERGGNNFQFFAPEMHAVAVKRLSLENELRNALRREEFLIHYQPIASLRSGEIVGAEALLRWKHPTLGLRLPDEFTSIAEDAGLIVPIGAWAVRAACEQMKNWQRQGIAPQRITVNISPRQFAEPHFIKMIAGVLRATRLDPSSLEIELTETGIMADIKRSVRIMRQLGSMGVRAAIDDFGIGYSSLGYLKQLPVASLKIDRQFIRSIESDSFDASIVGAMITVAHNRRLQVVAIGVETHAQRDALRKLGCDEIQGHLLSAPLPASELQRLLEQKPAAQTDAV